MQMMLLLVISSVTKSPAMSQIEEENRVNYTDISSQLPMENDNLQFDRQLLYEEHSLQFVTSPAGQEVTCWKNTELFQCVVISTKSSTTLYS
jgi:hypothetical protein